MPPVDWSPATDFLLILGAGIGIWAGTGLALALLRDAWREWFSK